MKVSKFEGRGSGVMRAINIENGQLAWRTITDIPSPGYGEVRIEVHATAINRADLAQAEGRYPPPPGASNILGLECSGVVAEIGDEVGSFEVGDEVCALLAGGGYAEYVNVPAGQVMPKPTRLSMVEAAALPEVFATAYLNVYLEANAQFGESVLIHSGASGVGTAAIQLCRLFGNPCMVTVGFDAKVRACLKLGATLGCNRRSDDFAERALEWTGNKGVDVILDPVGGSYLQSNLQCLAIDGRLVVIGLMGGAEASVPLNRLMLKRQRVIGSTLRARSIEAKSKVTSELVDKVWPAIEADEVHALVDHTLPIEDAQTAHELLRTDRTIGKIALRIK